MAHQINPSKRGYPAHLEECLDKKVAVETRYKRTNGILRTIIKDREGQPRSLTLECEREVFLVPMESVEFVEILKRDFSAE